MLCISVLLSLSCFISFLSGAAGLINLYNVEKVDRKRTFHISLMYCYVTLHEKKTIVMHILRGVFKCPEKGRDFNKYSDLHEQVLY